MLDGKLQQGMAASEFEFLADVGSVMLDRAGADEQFGGNLFTRLICGDQFENVPLGGSEKIELRLLRRGLSEGITAATLNEIGRERGADVVMTGGNRSDRIGYFQERAVFEHIAFNS